MKKNMKKSVLLFLALAILTLGISMPAAAAEPETATGTTAETIQETAQAETSEEETEETGETVQTEETTAVGTTAETEEAAASGDSSEVEAVKETASGVMAPAKVTGLKAESGEHSITLTWKKSSDADGYKIYLYTASNGKYTGVDSTKKNTYTITDLKADKEYTYVVAAYVKTDGERVFSKYSKAVSATPYSIIPAKVTGVKATAGDMRITLTWDKAENATGYAIYSYNTKTGEYTRIERTKKLKYTITGLKNDKKYTYVIRAYRKYGTEGKADLGKKSKKVSATPVFSEPTAPRTLELTTVKSGIKLEWSGVTNATGYYIYRYNSKTEKYTRIAKVKSGTTYTDKEAGDATYYKYKVVAYRRYKGKTYRSPAILKIIYDEDTVDAVLSKVHSMYYSATVKKKAPVYTSSSGDKIAMTVSAGTKVTVAYRRSGKYLSTVLINGKTYYMSTRYLRLSSQQYTSSDYTTEEKEIFVNARGYTSSSKYLVWVSTYTQRINVFKKDSEGQWVLYKTAQCGTGLIDTPTPLGTFKIYAHMSTHKYVTCSYSYWSKFKSSNAIHQRGKYYSNGAYVNATLGRPVSHGCVRTTDSMAQFIYYKVPLGTTLVVY